jgi:hypothetical protein
MRQGLGWRFLLIGWRLFSINHNALRLLDMNRLCICLLLFSTTGLLLACQSASRATAMQRTLTQTIAVTVTQADLTRATACEGHFAPHNLDFATGTRLREVNTYESNGAGVAVNDLDGDGNLDIVFASMDGEAAILWNRGNLKFTTEALVDNYTRGVNIVDVNGDGYPDIVFTHRSLESVSYWRNRGPSAQPRFARETLPGVTSYAYAMAWADLNNDGALDLVTGSYNTDLKQHGIKAPEQNENAGIVYYEHRGDKFIAQPLAQQAEALSIGLVDLNDDGQLDIWVANDFGLQDQTWLNNQQGGPQSRQPTWQPSKPFAQTSHSTMSIEWGDLANDGNLTLFTTDMNPYDISPHNLARWLPMMNAMEKLAKHEPGDPQIMANVLQVRDANGTWRNEAARWGVDATGWSWAGKFGDLDNDGFLDLYVVNGMMALNMFGYLPNGELVEENQAFRNQGDGMFILAPEWNLGSTSSGRGMVMADLNGDGNLDIIVNNMRNSAQLFENRLCSGSSLEVNLRWPTSQNTDAIGAQLELRTSHGVYRRDVRASGGYLSGDPMGVHFGFPNDATLQELDIIWPDGATSQSKTLTPHTRLEVTR